MKQEVAYYAPYLDTCREGAEVKKVSRIVLISLVAVGLGSLSLSAPASAQDRPCADEMKKFCQSVGSSDRQKRVQCLKEHEAELSSACKERLQTATAQGEKVRNTCSSDIQKFCKDAQPGSGTIGKCLNEHRAELSAECAAAFPARGKTPQKETN